MNRTIEIAPVRKSVTVDGTPAEAFDVFTAGIDRWWPKSHHIGAAPIVASVIEPRVGGRWYELGEDGSHCEWGKVLAWEPPRRVLLAWQINGEWKYDAALVTELEVRFFSKGSGTLVELEHRHLERMGASAEVARSAIDSPGGWSGLLNAFAQSLE